MRRLILPVFVLACLLVAPTAAHAAAAKPPAPAGAVVLKGALVKPWGATRCGLFAKQWRPGTVLARGYFVSHAQQSLNFRRLALRSRGRLAVSHRAKALRFARLARAQQAQCNVPRGAMKLRNPTAELAIRSGVTCLKVGSQPGIRFGSYFATHVLQAREANLLSLATRGALRVHFRAENARFNRLQNTQKSLCAVSGGGGGGVVTNPGVDQCWNIEGIQATVPAGMVKDGSGCHTPAPLRVNLAGAAGLAVAQPGASNSRSARDGAPTAADADPGTGSNLDVVMSDGQVADAVTSGSAVVSKFLIAPNDKAYLLFQSRVNLDDTSAAFSADGCLLAEVGSDSTTPKCVDSTLAFINWNQQGASAYAPPIQFDANGAIYYLGQTTSAKTVLRRYANGGTTDLINDNIMVAGFYVLPNGSVIIGGSTTATGASWLRRISPAGAIKNLSINAQMGILRPFPDGNVYHFEHDGGYPELNRYLTASDELDSLSWIRQNSTPDPGTRNNMYDFDQSCGGCWVGIRSMATTLRGEVFVLNGNVNGGKLMRYYPDLANVTSNITKPTIMQGVLNHLILSGLNASNQNVMYLHDTTDASEIELLGPSNEIEVYHLNYSASGKVLFDGLRFADNRYVLGEIDVNTRAVRVTAALGAKWDDFQTFN